MMTEPRAQDAAPSGEFDLDAVLASATLHYRRVGALGGAIPYTQEHLAIAEVAERFIRTAFATLRSELAAARRVGIATQAFLSKNPRPTGSKADRDDYVTTVSCASLLALHEAVK